MMISTLIFDLGGVIMQLNQEEAIHRFEDLGLKDARNSLDLYSQTGLFMDLEMGYIDENEFCKRLSKMTSNYISYEKAKYAWLGYIESVPIDQLHYIQRLRSKYRVILLTNTNPFIQSWARSEDFSIEKKPITDYFDHIYCSYELHSYKPNNDFFNKVMESERITPSEAIFIDDGKSNVDSASSLGMNVIWASEGCNWMSELTKMLDR